MWGLWEYNPVLDDRSDFTPIALQGVVSPEGGWTTGRLLCKRAQAEAIFWPRLSYLFSCSLNLIRAVLGTLAPSRAPHHPQERGRMDTGRS